MRASKEATHVRRPSPQRPLRELRAPLILLIILIPSLSSASNVHIVSTSIFRTPPGEVAEDYFFIKESRFKCDYVPFVAPFPSELLNSMMTLLTETKGLYVIQHFSPVCLQIIQGELSQFVFDIQRYWVSSYLLMASRFSAVNMKSVTPGGELNTVILSQQQGGGAGRQRGGQQGEAGAGVSTTKKPRQDEHLSHDLPSEAISFLGRQTSVSLRCWWEVHVLVCFS